MGRARRCKRHRAGRDDPRGRRLPGLEPGGAQLERDRGHHGPHSENHRRGAREAGDGGKVIVWSDGSTEYYGAASARGGANSGDGGLIEVSGKENLVFAGTGNASAPYGRPGTLLLDPKNIMNPGKIFAL